MKRIQVQEPFAKRVVCSWCSTKIELSTGYWFIESYSMPNDNSDSVEPMECQMFAGRGEISARTGRPSRAWSRTASVSWLWVSSYPPAVMPPAAVCLARCTLASEQWSMKKKNIWAMANSWKSPYGLDRMEDQRAVQEKNNFGCWEHFPPSGRLSEVLVVQTIPAEHCHQPFSKFSSKFDRFLMGQLGQVHLTLQTRSSVYEHVPLASILRKCTVATTAAKNHAAKQKERTIRCPDDDQIEPICTFCRENAFMAAENNCV